VLGIEDADHELTSPNAPVHIISKLVSPLVGKTLTIHISPGSLVHRAYGRGEVTEQFVCRYGLNPKLRDTMEKGPLNISGVDPGGEVRAVEISGHPFYIGTLYQPQLSSTAESPHPLIVAYLKAVSGFRVSGGREGSEVRRLS
jgi:CTP synthase (UTP-ammonia lyase)